MRDHSKDVLKGRRNEGLRMIQVELFALETTTRSEGFLDKISLFVVLGTRMASSKPFSSLHYVFRHHHHHQLYLSVGDLGDI